MNYPTCRTCKHWQKYSEMDRLAGYGRCFEVVHYPFYPEGQTALLFGSSGQYDSLITLPDFGCLLHEPSYTPVIPDLNLKIEGIEGIETLKFHPEPLTEEKEG